MTKDLNMQTLPFIPVILAGGSGERFWPLSRKARPKQFLTLDGGQHSLLQATAKRLEGLATEMDCVFVVTSNDYRSLVLEQLPDLPLENLLVEPQARDTAPAVLYAALTVAQHHPDAVMGIFTSDHRIGNERAFHQVIRDAARLAAETASIVTLGITPTYPATGYGYIERAEQVMAFEENVGYRVARFTEKPDAQTAEAFLGTGRFSWNSGIFVCTVQTLLEEYRTHQPELYATLSEAMKVRGKVREVFPTLKKISIDYAILEKSSRVMVIPAEFDWDDLGDWNALERLLRSESQNVSVGRHVGLDTEGAILYTTGGDDLIVTIGLEDVVVVRTSEVTLVVRKDRTQDIKKVVQQIKAHPELHRFA
ncbi:mannose-1-phosphate guanylyltransferase [Deinococcus cellulosilyticus]|uniref:mannose-1-phosphate guanylyltransferase n=1 Tax=Deinococcus cellulosilyticus (strain DSM 18568 / NBRC 106333 / KACC 11606 / 5516J-15) TaxID=1223518 RepID=A0A511MY91_DEIC1|nr:mannose-1-phosphate guanylyltransferase [Deinococcus cellulosilyticus]GEM45258.1 mannose-1-phosphate guanylyltransferase [Deinococcus cellulosilyticus NBRC 106333 = KACC 11606]